MSFRFSHRIATILRSLGCVVKDPRKRKSATTDAIESFMAILQLPKTIQTPSKSNPGKQNPKTEKKSTAKTPGKTPAKTPRKTPAKTPKRTPSKKSIKTSLETPVKESSKVPPKKIKLEQN